MRRFARTVVTGLVVLLLAGCSLVDALSGSGDGPVTLALKAASPKVDYAFAGESDLVVGGEVKDSLYAVDIHWTEPTVTSAELEALLRALQANVPADSSPLSFAILYDDPERPRATDVALEDAVAELGLMGGTLVGPERTLFHFTRADLDRWYGTP